jgi:hypothetical protein
VTQWAQSEEVPQAPDSSLSAIGVPEVSAELERRAAPLFFFSYAHGGRQNPLVAQFFNDLSEDVAEAVGRPTGSDPGFMDRAMRTGIRWSGGLRKAVGSCQVFIALLSDPYVTSQWCGKEWCAYSRRTVLSRAGDDATDVTGIIPVTWATPMPDSRVPPSVGLVQRFLPRELPGQNICAQYEAEGVYGLMRQRLEMPYRCVVWRLAQTIADFHFAYEVETLVLGENDVHDIFREPS